MLRKIFVVTLLLALFLPVLYVAIQPAPVLPSGYYNQHQSNDDNPDQLIATFLGTSSLLFSDGKTQIMIDGFFTRPSLGTLLFSHIAPDSALITESLQKLKLTSLGVVAVAHSHHDHAMDAAEISRQTGALVFGSTSTANIARGWGLPESQIRMVEEKESLVSGDFKVTLIRSRHAAVPKLMAWLTGIDEQIRLPLSFPARLTDFKEGGSFSVYIQHPLGNVLVQASAGYSPGALYKCKADVVFLGVAGLSKQSNEFQQAYFDEVVASVGAQRLIPIHWDDFMKPLSKGLVPLGPPIDDINAALDALKTRFPERSITLLQAWEQLRLY
ncbi:MAG: MBL fold metallo-hydrolase [Hahellaceae bacterium]|nr:MBL fold metallo-hydrolase [Hahellaceae bacterium]